MVVVTIGGAVVAIHLFDATLREIRPALRVISADDFTNTGWKPPPGSHHGKCLDLAAVISRSGADWD